MLRDVVAFGTRLSRGEFISYVVSAAAGGYYDVLEAREEADKVLLGGAAVRLAPAVRHGLSAAGLVERVIDFDAEAFKEFQGGNADLGVEDDAYGILWPERARA